MGIVPEAGSPESDGTVPKIELTTWYYEMLSKPNRVLRPLADGLRIERAEQAPVHFYRYLYNAVGGPWGWWERNRQSDVDVAAAIHNPCTDLFVAYRSGAPMGFAEVDRRSFPTVKLAYFGLIDAYAHRGNGGGMLDWVLERVWAQQPRRFWLTTCSLDSPAAVPFYERAGFRRFDTRSVCVPDPRLRNDAMAVPQPERAGNAPEEPAAADKESI